MPDQEPEQSFTIRDRRRSAETAPEPTLSATPPPAPPEMSADVTAAPLMDVSPEDAESMANYLQYQNEMLGPEDGINEMQMGEGEEMGDPNAIPDVYSVLALFLGELRNMAWLRMGLVANPATGELETDMEQAKVAINTVGFLASQLESVVAPEEKLPLRALVSDLQMTFTQQVNKASGG